MKLLRYQRSIRIDRPAAEVFAWHGRPGAFERLLPPWETVEVTGRKGGIRDGARVSLRAKVGPVWSRWEVEHRDYVEGVRFRDVQVRGPFALWEHLHVVASAGEGASVLTDEITYALPFGAAGRLGAEFVRRKLVRMFAYRHAVMKADLELAGTLPSVSPMRVLVSGASGLVGRALVPYLTTLGHEVIRLVRRPPVSSDEVFWDPAAGLVDLSAAGSLDAVVHLAGAGIAEGRWTVARREEILASRIEGTRTLVHAIVRMKTPPRVMVSASAVGFYGDTGDRVVDEESPLGRGFLAHVCGAWESELVAAESAGIRVVPLRFGVILTPAGGALARMLPVFQAGLGGRLGSGRQGMSWISIDDALGLVHRVLCDSRVRGPFNGVAPEPCTQAHFATALGRVMRRPAIMPIPEMVLKLAFGAMAQETLLASAWVRPMRFLALGHAFRHPTIEDALNHVLGRRTTG